MRRQRTAISLGLAVLLVLSSAPAASAWGRTGHRVVGLIAQNHLTKKAAREVAALIGPEDLAMVSNWADEIKSEPAWKHADPWHYMSVDDNEPFAGAPQNPAGHVLGKINEFLAVVKDRSAPREKRVIALKFLVHLVGDIHQPLHVGRRDDLGGNRINVELFRRPTNLHSVWDDGLISEERLSYTEWALWLDRTGEDQTKRIMSAPPEQWARESFDLRAKVYAIGDAKLSYPYAYYSMPVVKQRLLEAGLRLAAVLNEAFR